MRGIIVNYSENKGIISGQDGARYNFVRLDWLGKEAPREQLEVDFNVNGSSASDIYPIKSENKYSKGTLLILFVLAGGWGIHRIYVGKILSGVALLLLWIFMWFWLFLFFPFALPLAIILFIWLVIDFISILSGNFTDKDGNKI